MKQCQMCRRTVNVYTDTVSILEKDFTKAGKNTYAIIAIQMMTVTNKSINQQVNDKVVKNDGQSRIRIIRFY